MATNGRDINYTIFKKLIALDIFTAFHMIKQGTSVIPLVISTLIFLGKLIAKIPSIKYWPVSAPVAVDEIPEAINPIPHIYSLIYFMNFLKYWPAFSIVTSIPLNSGPAKTPTKDTLIIIDIIKIKEVSNLYTLINYSFVKSKCFLV